MATFRLLVALSMSYFGWFECAPGGVIFDQLSHTIVSIHMFFLTMYALCKIIDYVAKRFVLYICPSNDDKLT